MTAKEIFAKLKTIAPNVAFAVGTTPDPSFQWDGDGPDPQDNGYEPVDVDVTATAIVDGEMLTGTDNMGGHYVNDDEPDDELGGYLPQMLRDAAEDLRTSLARNSPLKAELVAVEDFLKTEMRDRYNAQRAEIEASRV
jgi:hypothetical protein